MQILKKTTASCVFSVHECVCVFQCSPPPRGKCAYYHRRGTKVAGVTFVSGSSSDDYLKLLLLCGMMQDGRRG